MKSFKQFNEAGYTDRLKSHFFKESYFRLSERSELFNFIVVYPTVQTAKGILVRANANSKAGT